LSSQFEVVACESQQSLNYNCGQHTFVAQITVNFSHFSFLVCRLKMFLTKSISALVIELKDFIFPFYGFFLYSNFVRKIY